MILMKLSGKKCPISVILHLNCVLVWEGSEGGVHFETCFQFISSLNIKVNYTELFIFKFLI